MLFPRKIKRVLDVKGAEERHRREEKVELEKDKDHQEDCQEDVDSQHGTPLLPKITQHRFIRALNLLLFKN